MRNTVADLIKEKAKTDHDLFLIAGDAGLGVWDTFRVEHQKQYINPGVNEALCVGMAAGMALMGHKVVYYNIAPFVIMRPYEQVRNDICYQELPVVLVGTGSGVTYAPAGMTHYVVEDIALARTMPNLNIFSPADPIEAKAAFEYAYQDKNPSYIRIPKAGEPAIHSGVDIDVTKPQVIKAGRDVLLLTHSSMIEEVQKADEILNQKGIDSTIATMPMVNSNDLALLELIGKHEKLFVCEEHFKTGGLGSIVLDRLNDAGINKSVYRIAIEDEYIHAIGNRAYMRTHYGIDGEGIVKKVLETI